MISVGFCFTSILEAWAVAIASFNSWFSTVTFGCPSAGFPAATIETGTGSDEAANDFASATSAATVFAWTIKLVSEASATGAKAVVLEALISSATTPSWKLNIAIIPNIRTPIAP